MQALSVKLRAKTYLAPDVLTLAFIADAPLRTFIPGQFLTFLFTVDAQEHYRPYSLATLDATQTLFTITLKIVSGGVASQHFQKMLPGAYITCFGPYGDFVLQQKSQAQRLILVATGTGIVPFHAMQQALLVQLAQHATLQVHLIHGVKTMAELIYRDVFDKDLASPAGQDNLLKHHPRFSYRFALSQAEQHLRVQHRVQQLSPITAQDDLYLCGNSQMIHAMLQLLRESKANIYIEKFS